MNNSWVTKLAGVNFLEYCISKKSHLTTEGTSTTVDTTTASPTTSTPSTTASETENPTTAKSESPENAQELTEEKTEKHTSRKNRPESPKIEDKIEVPDYPASPRASEGLQECPKYPDTLIGREIPDSALEIEWDQVEDKVAEGLLEGGCWEPEDCFSTTKTAIIVPYKDRETHLKRLLFYLHPFLRRQKISYCIVVAEQYHDGRFNKVSFES